MRISLVLLGFVADELAEIDREGRPAILQVALVLVVAKDDQCVERGGAEHLTQMLAGGPRTVLALHELGGRDHAGHSRVGFFEQIAVGYRAAFLVVVLDDPIGFKETGQRFIRGEKHRRMRRPESQYDLGH